MSSEVLNPVLLNAEERELVHRAFDELHAQRLRAREVATEVSSKKRYAQPHPDFFGIKEVLDAQRTVDAWETPSIPGELRQLSIAALRCLHSARLSASAQAHFAFNDRKAHEFPFFLQACSEKQFEIPELLRLLYKIGVRII